MTIHDQKHLALRLPNQALEKIQKDLRHKMFVKDHEIKPALIRQGADHVAAEAVAGGGDLRGAFPQTVGPSTGMIRPEAHLISPKNLRTLGSGLGLNAGIFHLKPVRDLPRTLFERTPDRFLGGEPPPLEVSAHRPDRQREPDFFLNQLADRLPRPQKKDSFNWSGGLSITIRAMRFCCLAVSEPPLGRPWRLARRALSPPSRYVLIHLPTA